MESSSPNLMQPYRYGNYSSQSLFYMEHMTYLHLPSMEVVLVEHDESIHSVSSGSAMCGRMLEFIATISKKQLKQSLL